MSGPRGKTQICGLQNHGPTSHLNSLLQTVPFSPEFRSKYVFCLFCRATCQNWICVYSVDFDKGRIWKHRRNPLHR